MARRRREEQTHKRRDSNAAKRSSCALEMVMPWSWCCPHWLHGRFAWASPQPARHPSITRVRVAALDPVFLPSSVNLVLREKPAVESRSPTMCPMTRTGQCPRSPPRNYGLN